MGEKSRKLVFLTDSGPEWKESGAGGICDSSSPLSEDEELTALLPDTFFFYLQNKVGSGIKGKRAESAASLRTSNLFPASDSPPFFVCVTQGTLLSCIPSAEMGFFIEQNMSILKKCRTVTTPFLLTCVAAHEAGLASWTYSGNSGLRAIVTENGFDFFRGESDELKKRLARRGHEGELPAYGLEEALQGFPWKRVRRERYDILAHLTGIRSEFSRAGRIWMYIAVAVVLLVVAGQFLRMLAAMKRADAAEKAIVEIYRRNLGDTYGADPYGRLLAKLEGLKVGQSGGIDPVSFLAAVSAGLPSGVKINSMGVHGDFATLKGISQGSEILDEAVKQLNAQSGYKFSLDSVNNSETDKGVTFSLKAMKL